MSDFFTRLLESYSRNFKKEIRNEMSQNFKNAIEIASIDKKEIFIRLCKKFEDIYFKIPTLVGIQIQDLNDLIINSIALGIRAVKLKYKIK